MEIKFRMEYFKSIYDRYQKASRHLKEKILDEFCKVCQYNRKYAIQKLNGAPPGERRYSLRMAGIKRRRPKVYSQQTINVLSKVWGSAGYVCGIRLKALLPLWLPWIERRFCLTADLKKQLLKISARQIDRRLKPYKFKAKKYLYGGTKPGSLLKHHIPIKTDHWDVKMPGFTEVDTVSHSGNNAAGLFAYSVNQTDILTGWVETRAVLGKGEKDVSAALDEMEKDFPFPILGIDSDNGSEFINHHLYHRCQQREIQFTRGRAYKKDDNAHIEQKNWTHVRKLLGWNRYDTRIAVNAMNDLYGKELRLFMNLFLPSMKLIKKERVGSRRKRKYDIPKTPLDRVIELRKGTSEKTKQLKIMQNQLDPFMLSKIIDKKLRNITGKANSRQSPKSISSEIEKQKAELSQREEYVLREVSQMLGLEVQHA